MAEKIGFIGIGIMGSGMTRNLLKAGFDLVIWNRTTSKMDPILEAGAKAGENPADVAANSDIIIICVSDTPDVEEVLFGDDGVIEGVSEGNLVIDCSTISPSATEEFAAKLAEKGAHMLDAPISGGSEGAAKGTLSIMVGGPAEQFERALPAFEAMGKTITHVGEAHGDGQKVKLMNQILVVNGMLALGEAFLFAEAGGLDLQKAFDAVSGGAAGSWALTNRGPQIIERDWSPGFMIDLQQKDIKLVLEAAGELGVPVLSCSNAFHMYRTLQKRGLGMEGNHALIKALENMSGIKVGGAQGEVEEE